MADIKTKKTKASVTQFLKKIDSEEKRQDAQELLKIFSAITKEKPKMWGESIVGFGEYHYKSTRSKQEGDWPLTGFSPRKQNLSLYLMSGFKSKEVQDLLKKLGKYKTSVSCLYIKRLSDIDKAVLKKLITISFKEMKSRLKKGVYEYC